MALMMMVLESIKFVDMSHRKYSLNPTPCCWTCCKLKKSRRVIEEDYGNGKVTISAPSIMDALAGYQCDNYWFGDKPEKDSMLCGGMEYESYTHNEQIKRKRFY